MKVNRKGMVEVERLPRKEKKFVANSDVTAVIILHFN